MASGFALIQGPRWGNVGLTLITGCLIATACDAGRNRAGAAPALDAVVAEEWMAGGAGDAGGLALAYPPVSGAISSGGRIAILDRSRARAYLLAPGGDLIRQLGRSGSAPGEFRQPSELGFSGDSLLWVSDAGNPWITWFDLDVDSVGTESSPLQQVPRTPWSAKGNWVLDEGAILGRPRGGGSATAVGDPPPMPIVLWPDGTRNGLQVVGMIESTIPRHREVRMGDGLRFANMSQALEGAPVLGVASGGRWFFVLDRTPAPGEVGEFGIVRYDPSGRIIDRLSIPYHSRPVDDRVRQWIEDQAQAYERQLPPTWGIEAEDIMEATWIPERLPPVRQVMADDEGFWILRERRFTLPERSGPGRRPQGLWERYDLRGNLVSRLELPGKFQGLAGSPNGILGWHLDSLDVPVIRYYGVEFRERDSTP